MRNFTTRVLQYTFLAEDGFLLVPTLQYAIILSYLGIILLSLLSAKLMNDKDIQFKDRFTRDYKKILFITSSVFALVLWLSVFYALFAMKQAKNPYLLSFIALAALVLTPTKWHYAATQLLHLKRTSSQFVLYTLLIFLLFMITTVWTHQYPNTMWIRFLIVLGLIIIYGVSLSIPDWRKQKNESI